VDPRVAEIFKDANEIQQRYIHARLIHETNLLACRSLGIHRSTPFKWSNQDELEEAITLLRLDKLEATRMALENELLEAVAALHRAIRDNGTHSVQAARAILDRAGFPAQSSVDVTSGGEPIRATIYIPDNNRESDD
jgi:hypothetical protein